MSRSKLHSNVKYIQQDPMRSIHHKWACPIIFGMNLVNYLMRLTPKTMTFFPQKQPNPPKVGHTCPNFLQECQCCTPLHEEYPQHHGHKGDPGVTPETCGAVGERAQVILVWVGTPGVENASYPQRLWVMRVKPWAVSSLCRHVFVMLKNTLTGGVS